MTDLKLHPFVCVMNKFLRIKCHEHGDYHAGATCKNM
jgi:hypothetical protein